MAELSAFRTYVEEVPDHDCGLDIKTVLNNALYGGAFPSRKQRFKKKIQRWRLVSRKHPYTNRFFKSTAALSNEIGRHVKCCPNIIHPFSILRSNWEMFMIIMHSTALMLFPFILAFPKVAAGEPYYKMDAEYEDLDEDELQKLRKRRFMQTVNWDYVLMALGFITMLDMVVNFNTGYVHPVTREIVMERKRIVRRYLLTYFFFDLFSIMPYGYVWRIHTQYNDLSYVWGEIVILLRIVRINSLYQYFLQVADRFHFGCLSKRIIPTLFIFGITIHWFACFNVMVDMSIPGHRNRTYLSWTAVNRVYGQWNSTYERAWRLSVLRTVQIICAVADRFPYRVMQDNIMNILMNLTGFILLYYLLAQVVIVTEIKRIAYSKYEEMQIHLLEYVKYKQVPLELEHRLLEFYRYCFQKNYYREPAILEFLSGQLRQEVLLHSCRRLVEVVPFFFNVPPHLLIRVVSCLAREVVLTNDVVMKAGCPGDSMYFISSGSVAVYAANGRELCHLKEGAHFGEMALVIEEESRTASVVAVETSELYSLSRRDFNYAVEPDPTLLASIRRTALKRFWVTGSSKKQSEKRTSLVGGKS